MWKSVPRGVRQAFTRYARQNPCAEDDKDSAVRITNLPSVSSPRFYHHHDNNYHHRSHEHRFRISESWSHLRTKHTLLEALGWGAALTAGLIASRPSLTDRSGVDDDETRTAAGHRGLLLEYALAMPVVDGTGRTGAVNDTTASAVRTKVNRSDSGFSECQPVPDQTPISSQTDRDNESDWSWDSSSCSSSSTSTSTSSSSSSSRLWDSLNFVGSNRAVHRDSSDADSCTDLSHESTDKEAKKSRTAVKAGTRDRESKQRYIVDEPVESSLSGGLPAVATFTEAVDQFEEVCRQVYGRHSNHCAIKALKNDDDMRAVHHWIRASRAGYDKGQYNLGRCYEDGIGTYRDLDKAKYYYSLAAAQGHVAASRRLNQMVTTEAGVRLFEKLSSAELAVTCSNRQDSRLLRDTG